MIKKKNKNKYNKINNNCKKNKKKQSKIKTINLKKK